MQEKPLTFSSYLRQLLEQWHMSAGALARKMNQPSKTTIVRILQGTAKVETEISFFDKMKATSDLGLTNQQLREMQEALEVSRAGIAQYQCDRAIAAMITEPTPDGDDVTITCDFASGERCVSTMADLADRLLTEGCTQQLWMTGYINPSIMGCLHRQVFQRYPGQTTAAHYLCCAETDIIYHMAAIMPLLYQKEYRVYSLPETSVSPEMAAHYRQPTILLRITTPQGDRFFRALLTGRIAITMVEYASERTFRTPLHLLLSEERWRPVKIDQPLTGDSDDYLHYTEWYYRMEEDAPAYIVRADLPIMFIHPDLMVPACLEGFQQTGFYPMHELRAQLQRYYDVQLLRYNNFFAKKKLTHLVLSWKPMLRFARTGATSDQFFAIRPYTPAERLAILANLRQQMENNAYFHLHFLKPDMPPIRNEISFYEGKGVFFCQGETDYNLAHHSDAIIVEEEFCKRYKTYFTNHLLRQAVAGYDSAKRMVDELIAVVRDQL